MRKVQTRETVDIYSHHDRYQQLILPTRAYAHAHPAAILPWSACLDCRRCISANVVSQERNSRAIFRNHPRPYTMQKHACILFGADESNARDKTLMRQAFISAADFIFYCYCYWISTPSRFLQVSVFVLATSRAYCDRKQAPMNLL
jgi:hypothetical protein